jgi:hypothetical protein
MRSNRRQLKFGNHNTFLIYSYSVHEWLHCTKYYHHGITFFVIHKTELYLFVSIKNTAGL